MTSWLGRWAPLIGGLILAASVILPLFGQSELASLLAGLGSITGLGSQSPVSGQELGQAATQVAASIALVIGIVRKFLSLYAKK